MISQEFLDKIKAEPGVPGVTLILIAEIERLQKKADTLYKAADAVADQIMDEMGMGAEFDKDGCIEVGLQKAEVEEFISVILKWDRED